MLKKGDKVIMHTCLEAEKHEGKIWVCRTDEYEICGSRVVMLGRVIDCLELKQEGEE